LFVLLQYLPKRSPPITKLKLIDSSIDKFRRALALDNKNADAMFNLGQALNTRAETVQDVDEIEDGYNQAAVGKGFYFLWLFGRCFAPNETF
jgi:Tfp pilus assembly protein PilF